MSFSKKEHEVTDETRDKISQSKIGIPRNDQTISKISQTKTGQWKKELTIDDDHYDSCASAADAKNTTHQTISNRCNSESFPNYKWVGDES